MFDCLFRSMESILGLDSQKTDKTVIKVVFLLAENGVVAIFQQAQHLGL